MFDEIIISKFTFQSGDIQILSPSPKITEYPAFTFQSGDIQILYSRQENFKIMYLHSNLVIFKFGRCPIEEKVNPIYIPIW